MREIDYLFEDPQIPSQQYALVSIVGPHMPQRSDVWGLKIRGTCDSLDSAKNMSARLNRIDPDFDIYTVEVGKFFPLEVEPSQLNDQIHADEKLNELVKNYKENRESANEEFLRRKNELVNRAIEEGKQKGENSKEHPISVLDRLKKLRNQKSEMEKNMKELEQLLQETETKYSEFSDEQKENAQEKLETVEKQVETAMKLENTDSTSDVSKQVSKITQELEKTTNELQELKLNKLKQDSGEIPKSNRDFDSEIAELEKITEDLRQRLNDKDLINEFVNSNFSNSNYKHL